MVIDHPIFVLLLIFLSEEVCLALLTFQKPDKILAMHKQRQQTHESTANHHKQVMIVEHNKTYGKCQRRQHAAQRNILGQKICDEEHNGDGESDPPVNAPCDKPAT